MKKLLFIAGIAASCTAFADSDTVVGTTEVGLLEVNNSTSTDCIVAVPFLEMTGGNICVSNLVKTANLTEGDELYVYGGTRNNWNAWVLKKDDTTHAKYWDEVGVASIGSDGRPQIGTSGQASGAQVIPGNAVWLKRAKPIGVFYVYGGYTNGVTTAVAANKTTLVANPTAAPVAVTGKIGTPAAGDTIWFINNDGMTQYIYGTKKGNAGWYTKGSEGYSDAPVDVPELAAGCGVWMKLGRNVNIAW